MKTKLITVAFQQQKSGKSNNVFAAVLTRYFEYADSQQKNRMLWFFLSLMVNGVFFLASPAFLIFMFGAPLSVLAITMLNFFANLIVNMGGAGIRTTVALFYTGIVINLACIAFVVL